MIEDRKANWLPPGPDADWPDWIRRHVRESVASGALVLGRAQPGDPREPAGSDGPAADGPDAPVELGPVKRWYAPGCFPVDSERAPAVVSPGRESGILLTPGGQSGNPLSPHFQDLTSAGSRASRCPCFRDRQRRLAIVPEAKSVVGAPAGAEAPKAELLPLEVDPDPLSIGQFPHQQPGGQRVLDPVLDHPLGRRAPNEGS